VTGRTSGHGKILHPLGPVRKVTNPGYILIMAIGLMYVFVCICTSVDGCMCM